MQPRLAYAATIEVPPSFCELVPSQDGGLAQMVSESDSNIDGNSAQNSAFASVLLKPTSISPIKRSYSTSNDVMVLSTRKSLTSDLIPVYPGNSKGLDLVTKHPDLIMMALAASSKTGERHGRNSPPSPPTVVNRVGTSVQPSGQNFITIDYNNVHRLPTNPDDSFLFSY